MVRTQLYLDEETHERLRELARKRGSTISELVRSALRLVYGEDDQERKLETLRGIEGLWRDRTDIEETDEYVRSLRRDTRPTRSD